MVTANRWIQHSWNPLREWQEVQREFAKLLSETRTRSDLAATKTPRIELHAGQCDAVLLASLPGLSSEDLEISVERDVVTLSGRWPERNSRGEDNRAFERAIRLPFRIDATAAQASLEDGRLELHLSRAAEDAPQKISIHGLPANNSQDTKD